MLAQTASRAAARRGFRLILALVCASTVAGCGPRRAEAPPSAVAAATEAGESSIPTGATVYKIDADRSLVTLRVYRAGRLAKLGHNHVITSANETGRAWTNDTPATSGFEVRMAVADLVVDDPAARAAAGADFPGEISEAARDGTRANMLRAEVLDGERYPEIVVRAGALNGTWEQPTVAASVTLKGQTRSIDVPLAIVRTDDAIVAHGAFTVLQSDFGITPFSIGGGAIAVADAVDISFEIRAVRQ
jgi:polyisoprenoid-binding protein YceI